MNALTWPSQFFTMRELTASETAVDHHIDNTPAPEVLAQLARTAVKMDRIRHFLSGPVHVNSGYRCLAVNRLLGSGDGSQHVKGQAVDFTCPTFGTPLAIVKAILAAGIVFDQIIFEGTWVHISFVDDDDKTHKNRREVLTAHRWNGKTTYTPGLPS